MRKNVLRIKCRIPLKRLRRKLLEAEADGGYKFIHVSNDAEDPPNTNLILLGRKDSEVRRRLLELARLGYYIYSYKEGTTRLVHSEGVRGLWRSIKEGEYLMNDEDVLHSVAMPVTGMVPKRMLVVFSSIHTGVNSPSLQRYFMQNFSTIQKFLPKDTAVLRVGDLGGVMGSFYLNTTHRPDNAAAIGRLIESVRADLKIDHDATTFYGGSKGGGGALYHGLRGDYRFVSVDPILSDKYYLEERHDAHFTGGGVYPEPKETVFGRLFDAFAKRRNRDKTSTRFTVICSERSPQYSYITDAMIKRFGKSIAFYNSRNPLILDHPDVGAQTVNTATMLMNAQLYGLPIRPGLFHID